MIDFLVKEQERVAWGGKKRERQSGQTLGDPARVSPSPALASAPRCVSRSSSLSLKERPPGARPPGSADGPEALGAFFLHEPRCSKYEGKGPETNLAVHSAGFHYGLSSVGFLPPLIINWQV